LEHLARVIEAGGRNEVALAQVRAPALLAPRELDAGARHLERGLLLAIAGLEHPEVGADLRELRFGPRERDPERSRIESQERLAGDDRLVLGHQYLGDAARNLGADQH